jgi:hypothetical protein
MEFTEAKARLIDQEFDHAVGYIRGVEDWEQMRERAWEQGEMLRKLASVVQRVGIPLNVRAFSFDLRTYPTWDDGKPLTDEMRMTAVNAGRLINAVARDFYPGVDREKINSEYSWGIKFPLDEHTSLLYSTPNEVTCEQVPVLDADGEPVLEEVEETVRTTVSVMKPKTEKKCISLFTT